MSRDQVPRPQTCASLPWITSGAALRYEDAPGAQALAPASGQACKTPAGGLLLRPERNTVCCLCVDWT